MNIYMREGDEIKIELPGGKVVSLLVNQCEDEDSLPELDIMFPGEWMANCWRKGLEPGSPMEDQPWSIACCQIVLPIEKD